MYFQWKNSSVIIKRFEAINNVQSTHIFQNSEQFLYYIRNIIHGFSAKSPVFTHVTSTLSGLAIMRAAKADKILKNEFNDPPDLNTATFFMTKYYQTEL